MFNLDYVTAILAQENVTAANVEARAPTAGPMCRRPTLCDSATLWDAQSSLKMTVLLRRHNESQPKRIRKGDQSLQMNLTTGFFVRIRSGGSSTALCGSTRPRP